MIGAIVVLSLVGFGFWLGKNKKVDVVINNTKDKVKKFFRK